MRVSASRWMDGCQGGEVRLEAIGDFSLENPDQGKVSATPWHRNQHYKDYLLCQVWATSRVATVATAGAHTILVSQKGSMLKKAGEGKAGNHTQDPG